MTQVHIQKVAHLILLGLFLTGLTGTGHLMWSELLRLAAVLVGVILVFAKYKHRLILSSDSSINSGAAGVLALTAAFVVTQFDPATSTVAQHRIISNINIAPVFWVLCAAALISLAGLGKTKPALRIGEWDGLDRIILGVVGVTAVLSVGSQRFFGGAIELSTVAVSVKILSYGCLWLAITRLYGSDVWEVDCKGFFGVVMQRWTGAAMVIVLLFALTLLVGGIRIGFVLHYFGEGRDAYLRGDYETASSYYENAAEWNRDVRLGMISDRYLADLAVYHTRIGKEKEAHLQISAIRQATLDPIESDLKEAEIYLQAEKWSKAALLLEGVLEKRGKDVAILDHAGKAYLELRDSQSFMSLCDQYEYFPELQVERYDDLLFLGNIYFSLARYADALSRFERLVELRPGDAYSLYKVGRAQVAQSHFKKASVSFRRALEIDPEFADAYYRLGMCLEAAKDTAGALANYEKAVQRLPNHLDAVAAADRLRTPGNGQ